MSSKKPSVTVKETNIMYSLVKLEANIPNCDVLFNLIHVYII